MAMRNFWVEADIDGRATPLSGGTRSKDGEMRITVRQRNKGNSDVAVKIHREPFDDILVTRIYNSNDDCIAEIKTER